MEAWMENTDVLVPFHFLQLQINEAAFCLKAYWELLELIYSCMHEQVKKEVSEIFTTSLIKTKFFTAVAGMIVFYY
jgi:hypothetical protein